MGTPSNLPVRGRIIAIFASSATLTSAAAAAQASTPVEGLGP